MRGRGRERETHTRQVLRPHYFSQSVDECGPEVEVACGPVSLANAMGLLVAGVTTSPRQIIDATLPGICASGGTSPEQLLRAAIHMGNKVGITAELRHPCTWNALSAGDILYVRSVALKNAQHGVQFEESPQDSHIVMVEAVVDGALVVINPDCRRCGKGFRHDVWGRMLIPKDSLEAVWQSTRPDGSDTKRAAVILSLGGKG